MIVLALWLGSWRIPLLLIRMEPRKWPQRWILPILRPKGEKNERPDRSHGSLLPRPRSRRYDWTCVWRGLHDKCRLQSCRGAAFATVDEIIILAGHLWFPVPYPHGDRRLSRGLFALLPQGHMQTILLFPFLHLQLWWFRWFGSRCTCLYVSSSC